MKHGIWMLAMICLLPLTAFGAYDVGDTDTFWVWDLTVMPPGNEQISATCRGEGDNVYVFVEDTAWGNGEMSQDDVDAIVNAWDVETPAGSYNPDQGIYGIETEIFGEPTDVDSDPKVILLFYNMGCFMGTCFDGTIRPNDLVETDPNGNFAEIIYINIDDNSPAGDYMLGVVAHEFNHLIHSPLDPGEEEWFSEAMAEAAMTACGYEDAIWLDDYLSDSDVTFWDDGQSVHYGAAMVLGTYIYEQLGTAVGDLIADPGHGLDPIEEAFQDQFGAGARFFAMLAQAMAANDFSRIDLSDLSPAYSISSDPYEEEKTISAGAIHFSALTAVDGPFEIQVSGDDLAQVPMFLAAEANLKSTEFSELEPNVALCADGDADGYLLVLANDQPTEDIDYTVSFAGVDACPGSSDDDDATDDDDAADDDDGEPSDDDDDDNDDGGCCG